jgi:hypothetical protein
MIGKSSMHSCSLMKKLLSHFAQQEKAPPNFMGRGDSGGSIVLGLACKFLLNLQVLSIIAIRQQICKINHMGLDKYLFIANYDCSWHLEYAHIWTGQSNA